MHVDVVDNFEAFAGLREAWDAVHAADPEAQVFTTFSWIEGALKRLIEPWLVLYVKSAPDAADYEGFCPLALQIRRAPDGRYFNDLRTGGSYLSGYNNVLCRPEREAETLAAMAQAILRLNWTSLHLENIAASPRRLQLFLQAFPEPGFRLRKVPRPDDGDGVDHDTYVYVDLPDSFETFLEQRLGSATRRTARRTLRAIDDPGEYRVTHATAQTLERDLQILLKFWNAQWGEKLTARYGAALPRAMMRGYGILLSAAAQGGSLLLLVLWRGDEPVGVQASLIDAKARSVVCMLGGRDMALKKPAPGFALHLYSIRWAIAQGLTTYDLQTGNFAYKYDFGGQERTVECLEVGVADGRNLRHRLEPRSIPRLVTSAEGHLLAGRAAEAENICRQVLQADPACAAADRLLSQILGASAPRPAAALGLAGQLKPAPATPLMEQIRRATAKSTGFKPPT
jgi:CelD/BcsL family acetyltransferase involved in cellulose biosynthesis